jgi:NAD(P)-dependent dehydrogenase (short-subunit alcohol dehydrogenase family)
VSNVGGRRALVTGGASGIGAAIVRILEGEGYDVRVLDLRTGFDVADPAAWKQVEPVDVACLNAGVGTATSDLTTLTDEEFRRVVRVNVDGVVFGTRALTPLLPRGGRIIVTASLAGLVALPGDPIYALTKHALVGFVRSVAPQLEARGISINAVCPGITDTPLLGEAARAQLLEAGFPLLTPDDVVAGVMAALRSSETGQAWVVQPGRQPLQFRFPGVPGPRTPGAEGRRPPATDEAFTQ